MSSGKKLGIFFAVLLLLGGVVAVSVYRNGQGLVTVQTSRAARGDLAAQVTASGEITPKTFADISANAMGQITDLLVKEGDQVHEGQLLAKLWNVQQAASVTAMQATVKTMQANYDAQQAAVGTAQAQVERDTAQLAQLQAAFDRSKALFDARLLARQDYDTAEANYKTAVAQLKLSTATLKQNQAQLASMEAQINQAQANLKSAQDVLDKTQFTSPLNGVVTYLPVHVGDTVVMGIQNSPGSELMRVADMSVVTAEVQVDETDIANVRLGQPATLTIDAYGDRKFQGKVTQVGDNALLRSTGAAATSSTGSDAQQAKDFKVVVTLDEAPPGIRPGLSCTAKITTATAHNAVQVPLQALVERDPSQLNPVKPGTAQAAPAPTTQPSTPPLQGVFVVRNGEAVFVPVQTGVTGIDAIEVTQGLGVSDEVVTGPYKQLRTMTNHTRIKVDNSLPATPAPPAS